MVRIAALAVFALMMSATTAPAQVEASGFFVPVGSDSVWVTDHAPSIAASQAPLLLLLPGFPAAETDVLGLGQTLSRRGVRVLVMQPRGHGRSSGFATFSHALEDVGAVLESVESTELVGGTGVVLGGHSWGGGISLAYAAANESVGRILSIASSDHGVFIRRVDSDPAYGAVFREALGSLERAGPVRFNVEADFEELRRDWATHDLATIAPRLADRDILIIAGWDDELVELEHQVLPFYRALTAAGSNTARIVSFQDGHQFQSVRDELHESVYTWLVGGGAG